MLSCIFRENALHCRITPNDRAIWLSEAVTVGTAFEAILEIMSLSHSANSYQYIIKKTPVDIDQYFREVT